MKTVPKIKFEICLMMLNLSKVIGSEDLLVVTTFTQIVQPTYSAVYCLKKLQDPTDTLLATNHEIVKNSSMTSKNEFENVPLKKTDSMSRFWCLFGFPFENVPPKYTLLPKKDRHYTNKWTTLCPDSFYYEGCQDTLYYISK